MKEKRMEGHQRLSFHPFLHSVLNPGLDCHRVVLSDDSGRACIASAASIRWRFR